MEQTKEKKAENETDIIKSFCPIINNKCKYHTCQWYIVRIEFDSDDNEIVMSGCVIPQLQFIIGDVEESLSFIADTIHEVTT